MRSLPTPHEAVQTLMATRGRVAATDLHRLIGVSEPGIYAWFVDREGGDELAHGIGLAVQPGLIYAGQAGAGTSRATLVSRIRRNHLGGDLYGSTFRLTLASALAAQLALAPAGGGRMGRDSEGRLTEWMRRHLKVAVIAYPDRYGLDAFESLVLELLDPPLNIAKRPPTPLRQQLTILRRPFSRRTRVAVPGARGTVPVPAAPTPDGVGDGVTPEQLARELGLPNAKRVRGFLRERYPRPASELWSRWGALTAEMEHAVRERFGSGR